MLRWRYRPRRSTAPADRISLSFQEVPSQNGRRNNCAVRRGRVTVDACDESISPDSSANMGETSDSMKAITWAACSEGRAGSHAAGMRTERTVLIQWLSGAQYAVTLVIWRSCLSASSAVLGRLRCRPSTSWPASMDDRRAFSAAYRDAWFRLQIPRWGPGSDARVDQMGGGAADSCLATADRASARSSMRMADGCGQS